MLYSSIFVILELTHKDLVTYVAPHVITKLREIGTALALTPPELDDIEENHQGITGVFQLWYETKRCPYTWDTLLMILTNYKYKSLNDYINYIVCILFLYNVYVYI